MATTNTSTTSAGAASDRPTAVLILGMHRSGTSALTRVLNLLGVELGSELMAAAEDNNETGFWEHQAIVDSHEALMASWGMRWHDPRALPQGWQHGKAAARARREIEAVIAREFQGCPLWGVKDPRMCRLLPLWRPILADLGVEPRIVHMQRQPLEIARSIERRDLLPRGHALLLWLRHQIEALRASEDLPQVWVTYDGLMSDWRDSLAPAAATLGLQAPDAEVARVVEGFLSPGLRHHVLDGAALDADPALADWVGALFKATSQAAAGEPVDLIGTAGRIEREIDRAGFYFDETFAAWSATELKLLEQIAIRDGQIRERDAAVAERDGRLAERDGRVAERDSRIVERDLRIVERDRTIAGLAKALSDKDDEIANHRQQAEDINAHLNALTGSLSWRVTTPLRWLRTALARTAGVLRVRTHHLRPFQLQGLTVLAPGRYRSSGNEARMSLTSNRGWLPSGWVEVSFRFSAGRTAVPCLFASADDSLTEADRVRLPPIRDGRLRALVNLPRPVKVLRLDPVQWEGEFTLEDLRFRELNQTSAALRNAARLAAGLIREPHRIKRAAKSALTVYRRGGLQAVRQRLFTSSYGGTGDYGTWTAMYDTLTDEDRAAIKRHIEALAAKPTFSLVMPTYNTPPEVLRKAIESVRSQLYPSWELCIADDASTNVGTRSALTEIARLDERIRVTFRESNGHISAASNTALDMATGDYVALLDHDDELPEHALYRVALELNEHPEAAILYSDEDKIDGDGARYQPYFKPDFNPDLFLAQNLVSHLGVYRRDLLSQLGGFRLGFEGSQDHALALRASERVRPDQIRHIPSVLYHWRAIEGSVATTTEAKPYALDAARRAIREHLARQGIEAEVVEGPGGVGHRVLFPLPATPPLVSVVVPTRDRLDLLRTCVDGLIGKTDYTDWELLVVDNGSTQQETLDWLAELVQREPRARVIRDDGPFNFSRLNNRAAAEARGELLLLLNNDVEPIDPAWMTEMVRHAVRPHVGIVGAKLYYPDETVQHAGVVLGLGGIAGHVHRGLFRNDPGYFGRAGVVQDMTAVTAACLMVRKSIYDEVGGLDEDNLAVAFNDIDFCLRVREKGHRILWTPYATLYHYESVSRGNDMDPDKIDRFKREIAYMNERWNDIIANDPNYNLNLAIDMHVPSLAFPPRQDRAWEAYLTV